jgi:hypothetical protein
VPESVVTESTARAMLEAGDSWTDHVARLAFPIVLWCAKHGYVITYGELAKELQQRYGEERKFPTLYGRPAGKMGDVLEALSEELDDDIPPVNVVIVNGDTKLPGTGVNSYLERFLRATERRKSITDVNRDAMAKKVIEQAHYYDKWDSVARHLGYDQLVPARVIRDRQAAPIELPTPVHTQGSGGEGELHRRLKEWVAGNPECFAEFGAFKPGKTEVPLLSGDEVDVLFEGEGIPLVVEVKARNAPDSDLWRGLFQCVKYRAVLQAMQLARGYHPNAQALLVVEGGLPSELVRLAKRLQIRWMTVKL